MVENTLEQAIVAAAPERLRTVLLNIISQSDTARNLASAELLAAHPSTNDNVPRSSKCKHESKATIRFLVCCQCEQEFDTTKNSPQSCKWHSGDCEIDESSDAWVDIWGDEWDHFELDTPEARQETPERFHMDMLWVGGEPA